MKKIRAKKCYVCGEVHHRASKYCSSKCDWHDKKYLGRKQNEKNKI